MNLNLTIALISNVAVAKLGVRGFTHETKSGDERCGQIVNTASTAKIYIKIPEEEGVVSSD